ncbi:hypothetical protein BDN72DRAFT_180152 [Pluteus cervinus]|uniref:Uncharacterized protein n=1 Tax=Pluteus cervinus TaxID=181527 RepID=A0ACD3AJE2_9AGAR|nr:hypothetical protein BDN72DRAFT_180152 [Pluteus cervinus]
MLTILLGVTLAYLRVGALPISADLSVSPPTIHTDVSARCDCSGTIGDGRTLYDIVKGCLFTIAACVYRAVHQNIPDPELGFWGRLRVTTKVTLYVLIAPELIIWWAMRQWFGARRVAGLVNDIQPALKWTKTHGQFAQMGGFARKDNKRVLHPDTLLRFLRHDLLDLEELQLTEKEIQDKSKGDVLSKTLVAFQTTWFVFECIARLQQGLPLIELEVVTLAFATLNVITYALWWYKPLNVLCPIYLHVLPEVLDLPTESPVVKGASPMDVSVGGGGSSEVVVKPAAVFDPVSRMSSSGRGAVVGETAKKNMAESGDRSETMPMGTVGRIVAAIKEDIKANGWWCMLWKRLIKEPFLAVALPLKELLDDEKRHDKATHVSTFYAQEIELDDEIYVQGLSSFIGMIFGAIHFISWDSIFPTHVESFHWRTSSIILVVPPLFLLLRAIFTRIYLKTPLRSRRERMAKVLYPFFEKVSFFLGPIPYILARFCVLILAFLALRNLPPDALKNLSWTSYIPHL